MISAAHSFERMFDGFLRLLPEGKEFLGELLGLGVDAVEIHMGIVEAL